MKLVNESKKVMKESFNRDLTLEDYFKNFALSMGQEIDEYAGVTIYITPDDYDPGTYRVRYDGDNIQMWNDERGIKTVNDLMHSFEQFFSE